METLNESVKPVVVVTGASSGIGMETAIAFARKGYHVVLAARRTDRLEQVAQSCRDAAPGASAMVVPTDVADEPQVQRLVAQAEEAFGRVDVMVNNAGYGLFCRVAQVPTDEMRRIFDVNFMGVFYGCKAVAPIMIRQRRGHIFNVSSVLGKRGSPFDGAYCATKHAINGLSDSLRVEMREHNVHVTTVCPGLTETEFFRVQAGTAGHKKGSFHYLRGRMPASTVARAIVEATGKNRPEMVFTIGGKFMVALANLSPRLADGLMTIYYRDLIRRAPK